jgi:methionine-rich copper-binding protein CopC
MSIRPPRSGAIVNLLPRGSRTSRVGFAAVAGLVTALLIAATAAFGHAELATVTPADKSTVQGSPTEIVMTFVQNLDPAKSSIVVVDSANKVVVKGGTVPAGQKREMDLAITTPLAAGTYTIRWTTISTEDGETARGTTTFTVAEAASVAPSAAPSASAVAPSTPPSIAPSTVPSVAASAAPSSSPATPATSTTDAVIPVVIAVIVLAGLGAWLLRSRARAR